MKVRTMDKKQHLNFPGKLCENILSWAPHPVVFPFYHAVSDQYCAHLRNFYHIYGVNRFEKDLDGLLRNMTPVSIEDAISNLSKDSFGKPAFHLSFDDGLREVKEVIAPLLLKKGIPATFFVTSGFTNNAVLFHRHKASLILEMLKTLNSKAILAKICSIINAGKADSLSLQKAVRAINFQTAPILNEIAKILNIDFDEFLKQEQPYLNAPEINGLADKGFSIGLHSLNHPEFYLLDETEMNFQITESRERLFELTGIKSSLFSFPFTDSGIPDHFIQNAIRQYKITTFGTAGIKDDSIEGHFQRIPMDVRHSNSAVQLITNEILRYRIKVLLRRQKVKRQFEHIPTTNKSVRNIKTAIPLKYRLSIRINLIRFTGLFYRGKNFGCNLCGKSFRKMIPHGNTPRLGAKCPNCLSLERTRVLWFYLKNQVIDNTQQLKILHFAPEYGLKKVLQNYKNIDYKNVDIDPDLADEVVDITNIPYAANSFDLILCSHVLGHVPDERKAIDELYRVLKPGGQALVMTIINWHLEKTFESPDVLTANERLEKYTEPDLVRLHGPDFASRLGKSGFNVEVIDYASQLGYEAKTHFSLGNGDREIIFKCTKHQ